MQRRIEDEPLDHIPNDSKSKDGPMVFMFR